MRWVAFRPKTHSHTDEHPDQQRHLYLTDEEVVVDVRELLRVIYVPAKESFSEPNARLEDWLDLCDDHFYLSYSFPAMTVRSWEDRRRIKCEELNVCKECLRDRLDMRKQMYEFLDGMESKKLQTLDIFGGVGAFSRGIAEGSGCLEPTHSIEIAPSAAMTLE